MRDPGGRCVGGTEVTFEPWEPSTAYQQNTGIDPEHLRLDELVRRIDEEGVRELVIATNPTMVGEATALYLADLVRGRVRVTRLASGLPVGADLEHADELTLGRALLGRRDME